MTGYPGSGFKQKADALDLGHSEIVDHNNPMSVKFFVNVTPEAMKGFQMK